MKKYFNENRNSYYCEYINDVIKYSSFTLSVLGFNVSSICGEKKRLELVHSALCKYPFAYPLAIELSLYMPDAAAIDWVKRLVSTYYSREDVIDEVNALLVWRAPEIMALEWALTHIEKGSFSFKSVLTYLNIFEKNIFDILRRQNEPCGLVKKSLFAFENHFFKFIRKSLLILKRKKIISDVGCRSYKKIMKASPECSLWKKVKKEILVRILASGLDRSRDCFIEKLVPLIDDSSELVGNAQTEKGAIVINFSTAIWGSQYLSRFFEFNFPSLLSQSVFLNSSFKYKVKFIFYTTRSDAQALLSDIRFLKLLDFGDIKFFYIDKLLETVDSSVNFTDKYLPMLVSHCHSWRIVSEGNGLLAFNFPDVIYQFDYLEKLLKLYEKGKECIYIYTGPYVEMNRVSDELKNYREAYQTQKIDNHKVREIFFDNLHPYKNVFHKDNEIRFFGATLVITDIGEDEFVLHTTCICPNLIKPTSLIKTISSTVDHFMTWHYEMDPSTIFIAKDNYYIATLSLDPKEEQCQSIRIGNFDTSSFCKSLKETMNLFNYILFTKKIYFSRRNNTVKSSLKKEEDYGSEVLTHLRNMFSLPNIEYFYVDSYFKDF